MKLGSLVNKVVSFCLVILLLSISSYFASSKVLSLRILWV